VVVVRIGSVIVVIELLKTWGLMSTNVVDKVLIRLVCSMFGRLVISLSGRQLIMMLILRFSLQLWVDRESQKDRSLSLSRKFNKDCVPEPGKELGK
jgi:hypothetical protein